MDVDGQAVLVQVGALGILPPDLVEERLLADVIGVGRADGALGAPRALEHVWVKGRDDEVAARVEVLLDVVAKVLKHLARLEQVVDHKHAAHDVKRAVLLVARRGAKHALQVRL